VAKKIIINLLTYEYKNQNFLVNKATQVNKKKQTNKQIHHQNTVIFT